MDAATDTLRSTNLPLASATAHCSVASTTTVAKLTGAPVLLSVTVPLRVMPCARTPKEKRRHASTNNMCFKTDILS